MYHREIEAYFEKRLFDVVCISAVVSTANFYTKYLSELIPRVSPNTLIVVGGNLAASSVISLNKCKVDCCVLGDGEFIIRDLMPALKQKPINYDRLRETQCIAFFRWKTKFLLYCFCINPINRLIERPT